jgi:hypothetical protein
LAKSLAKVLVSIPAFFYIVESEGLHADAAMLNKVLKKSKKPTPLRKKEKSDSN